MSLFKFELIKNEQHEVLPEQIKLLADLTGNNYGVWDIPAKGWTKQEMDINLKDLLCYESIIFLSPIAYMIGKLVKAEKNVYIFFNEHREKIELPNGKVISKVPQTGWELLKI